MAWTSPKTWNTNDLVTANDLNQQVRDNLNHLYTLGNQGYAADGGLIYAYHTSPLQLGSLSVTLTTVGRPVLLVFSSSVKVPTNVTAYFQWYEGSAALGLSVKSLSNSYVPIELTTVHPVAAGAHTWHIRWYVSGGTPGEVVNSLLYAIEV